MLHGHENLSYDEQGYIYWRGIEVEHFNRPLEQEGDAHQLAIVCAHLDAIGVSVSTATAVYYSQWFMAMDATHPYKDVLSVLTGEWECNPVTGEIAFVGVKNRPYRVLYYDGQVWHHIAAPRDMEDYNQAGPWAYRGLRTAGFEKAGTGGRFWSGTSDSPLEGVIAWLTLHGFTPGKLTELLTPSAPVEREMAPRGYRKDMLHVA